MNKEFLGIDDRILLIPIYDEDDINEQDHPKNE